MPGAGNSVICQQAKERHGSDFLQIRQQKKQGMICQLSKLKKKCFGNEETMDHEDDSLAPVKKKISSNCRQKALLLLKLKETGFMCAPGVSRAPKMGRDPRLTHLSQTLHLFQRAAPDHLSRPLPSNAHNEQDPHAICGADFGAQEGLLRCEQHGGSSLMPRKADITHARAE